MDCKRLLGGGLACATLLAAGCGGGPSGGGLSRTELASRVNAACAAYAKASTAVPQPRDLTSNPISAAAYLDKLKPLVVSEHAAIAHLKPTARLRARFAAFQVASTHQLGLFESALAKAHAKDSTALRDLVSAADYKQSVMLPLERQLGFTTCAR